MTEKAEYVRKAGRITNSSTNEQRHHLLQPNCVKTHKKINMNEIKAEQTNSNSNLCIINEELNRSANARRSKTENKKKTQIHLTTSFSHFGYNLKR